MSRRVPVSSTCIEVQLKRLDYLQHPYHGVRNQLLQRVGHSCDVDVQPLERGQGQNRKCRLVLHQTQAV
jgi:hypothetical protein